MKSSPSSPCDTCAIANACKNHMDPLPNEAQLRACETMLAEAYVYLSGLVIGGTVYFEKPTLTRAHMGAAIAGLLEAAVVRGVQLEPEYVAGLDRAVAFSQAYQQGLRARVETSTFDPLAQYLPPKAGS